MYKELVDNPDILALFDYGSIVYGTNHEKSDKDLIAVVRDDASNTQYSNKNIDVNVYTLSQFKELIQNHEITALECLFLDKKHIHKQEVDFDFVLDKPTLRNSISQKSSNSWVKAKKKFIVEEDFAPYIGQKSAWHAVRMLDFGIQIAKEGKITNYSSMNLLLKEILKCDNWPEIDQNFRLTYNNKASEFRLVAPKETKPVKLKS